MIDREELDNKEKALSSALQQIEKAYGKGSIMKLGQCPAMDVDVISTGSISLDMALGVGGFPKGRIIELFGPESSGKTTLALHVIAEAQKTGGVCAFIDAEHALDPIYAKKLGVNINELMISQPDNGEQALEIVDTLVRSNAVDVIVVDSVAALVPKAEIDGEMGDAHVGLHARLIGQASRKLLGPIARSKCVVIFINQIRMKIGVMFGNPETTTGGQALKFSASVRLEIRKINVIKKQLKDGDKGSNDEDNIIGCKIRIKVVKNKVGPPFKVVEISILFDSGINKSEEILQLGLKCKLIEQAGAWYSYGNTKIGHGKDNATLYLRTNVNILQELEQCIRKSTGNFALLDDNNDSNGLLDTNIQ